MKDLVLGAIKSYAEDLRIRKIARKEGVRDFRYWLGVSGPRDPHPLSECTDAYLEDLEFMSKAVKIDSNSIKFAPKKLRQNKSFAKIILKIDEKLAKKFIFKKTLNELINNKK